MRIAYSYIRFSTLEQLKGNSKRRQMELSRDWCERNKFTLDESLQLFDEGVSAFKGKNATQGKLGAFIKAVEAGQVKRGSVLLIESLDRLSRNQVPQALQLFLHILNLGIVIVTLSPEERFELKTLNEIQLIVAIITLSVNAGVKVRRVAERKCDTVTIVNPAGWQVSIPLLSFACGLPSFETAL